jgi:hypothetical protein
LGGKEGGGGKGGEMTQTLYAHMNKRKTFKQSVGDLLLATWNVCHIPRERRKGSGEKPRSSVCSIYIRHSAMHMHFKMCLNGYGLVEGKVVYFVSWEV